MKKKSEHKNNVMPGKTAAFINRRDFLVSLPMAGAALPLAAQAIASTPSGNLVQLENKYFKITFNKTTGSLNILRNNGDLLISGAVIRVQTAEGWITSSHTDYRHDVKRKVLQDPVGDGEQLIITSKNTKGNLDFEQRITLFNEHVSIGFDLVCTNTSKSPLTIKLMEPVFLPGNENAALHWPGTQKLLTNGPMYYDAGHILNIPLSEHQRSWWNIGLFRGYHKEGLVFGAIENQSASGQIVLNGGENGAFGLSAESVLSGGFILEAGKNSRSNRFVLLIRKDPYTALEDYAGWMGSLQNARVNSKINGWCSWFYSYEHVTEEEVVRNAEFVSGVLKPFGMEYIQVDEGYQQWHGDWEGNSKFPHGMKWLADRIRSLGLKPGLWIAPYTISENSSVFKNHPEWLIRHPDGRLKRVGPWPDENSEWARNENPKRYGLDVTHPGAAEWLFNLFDMISNQWGYEMIKIDFVDWSLLSAHQYHDPCISRAQVYRKGFEIMRKAIGPQCHLQDCGPGPVTVGLLDSMRIELDQNYGYRKEVWKQYFLNSSSSAPAAAKRYYFHGRTWINDADHVCLNLLSLSQAQAAASLIALTGGNLISGDRLTDLDESRLDILKKIIPSSGIAARPVDLFDNDIQTAFAVKIKKPFGEWTVVGVFNGSETDEAFHNFPLNRLWLDPDKTYIAYDFWKDRFLGEVTKELPVRVNPAGVTLISLHERKDIPQLVSTSRHVLQGALELEDIQWDQTGRILKGVSTGPLNTSHNVAIFVPTPRKWVQGGTFLYHDFPGYTLKMMEEHILRVHVRFGQNTRVEWKINFGDLPGQF